MLVRKRASSICILVLGLILVTLLASCGPSGLPEQGQMALNMTIQALAGSQMEYRILSAQKAPGTPEERQVEPQLPSSSNVSGCPPDYGHRETWCVVIGPPVVDVAGRNYAHFLVWRLGNSWYAEKLSDAEASRFDYVGCTNWDTGR